MANQEIIVEDETSSIRPILPKKRRANPFNVQETCSRLRCNPIEILCHIALGDNDALGSREPIRNIERRLAATELASYTVAKIKPQELDDGDMELENIPVFIPKRGVTFQQVQEENQHQQAQLSYDRPSGLVDDDEEDEDALFIEESIEEVEEPELEYDPEVDMDYSEGDDEDYYFDEDDYA